MKQYYSLSDLYLHAAMFVSFFWCNLFASIFLWYVLNEKWLAVYYAVLLWLDEFGTGYLQLTRS